MMLRRMMINKDYLLIELLLTMLVNFSWNLIGYHLHKASDWLLLSGLDFFSMIYFS